MQIEGMNYIDSKAKAFENYPTPKKLSKAC